MHGRNPPMDRRHFIQALGVLGMGMGRGLSPNQAGARGTPQPLLRPIPASGERLPAIGLGSWITLDVGDDPRRRASRLSVLQAFFDHGGGMIDSSPMYGSAEDVIGWSLARIRNKEGLFSATKVWTVGREEGQRQIDNSRRLWGVPRLDLIHVHNLLDWPVQLETLKAMKAEGRV